MPLSFCLRLSVTDFLKLGRCNVLFCVSTRIKRLVSKGACSARQTLTKDVNQTTVTCRKERPVLSVRCFARQCCLVVIRCFDICSYLGRHRRHDAALSKPRPSLKCVYIYISAGRVCFPAAPFPVELLLDLVHLMGLRTVGLSACCWPSSPVWVSLFSEPLAAGWGS